MLAEGGVGPDSLPPPYPSPASSTQATAYPDQDSIQAFLLANTENAIAAVFFIFDTPGDSSKLSGFVLETNTTVKFFKGTFQDPNFFVQLPLQSAVQREISRYYMAQVCEKCGVYLAMDPHTQDVSSKACVLRGADGGSSTRLASA